MLLFLLMVIFIPHRCTIVYGTPTMFADMIDHPDLDKYDLSSVKGGEKRP